MATLLVVCTIGCIFTRNVKWIFVSSSIEAQKGARAASDSLMAARTVHSPCQCVCWERSSLVTHNTLDSTCCSLLAFACLSLQGLGGGLLVLEGTTGVGKSQLLAACAADWRRERVAVLGMEPFAPPHAATTRRASDENGAASRGEAHVHPCLPKHVHCPRARTWELARARSFSSAIVSPPRAALVRRASTICTACTHHVLLSLDVCKGTAFGESGLRCSLTWLADHLKTLPELRVPSFPCQLNS